MARVRTILVLG